CAADAARPRRRGDRMNRRELIALFGSAAAVAWPNAMWAEQPQRPPTIGFLGLQPASAFASRIEALRKGLHDLGYVEGKNLLIDFQWADTVDQLPRLASLLVESRVNLIFAPASTYVEPARQATETIPIVFANHADPVGLAHGESVAPTSGNLTGLAMVFAEIAAKALDILNDAIPTATRIGVFWNTTTSSHGPALRSVHAAAEALGVRVHEAPP